MTTKFALSVDLGSECFTVFVFNGSFLWHSWAEEDVAK